MREISDNFMGIIQEVYTQSPRRTLGALSGLLRLVVGHLVVEDVAVDVEDGLGGPLAGPLGLVGLEPEESGTLADQGRKPSTTSSVSAPALGICSSSHSTYRRRFRPLVRTVATTL